MIKEPAIRGTEEGAPDRGNGELGICGVNGSSQALEERMGKREETMSWLGRSQKMQSFLSQNKKRALS